MTRQATVTDYLAISNWIERNKEHIIEQRMTLSEIKENIKKHFNLDVSQKTISELKSHFGIEYTRKRSKNYASLKEQVAFLTVVVEELSERLTKLECPDNN